MVKISRKLFEARKLVDKNKLYPLNEAIQLAQKTSYSKFAASLDLAFNLNLDVRQANEQLRGSIPLPYSTGKKIVVLVVTDEPKLQEEAKKAGADLVMSSIDLKPVLDTGKLNFDLIITEPKMMPFLGRYGKILGPKGLMPNPKTGTITLQIAKAVEEVKKGKANYRTDKSGIIHTSIGKTSMNLNELIENANTVIKTIKKIKPTTVKGTYIKNLTISATMGPSIKIAIDN